MCLTLFPQAQNFTQLSCSCSWLPAQCLSPNSHCWWLLVAPEVALLVFILLSQPLPAQRLELSSPAQLQSLCRIWDGEFLLPLLLCIPAAAGLCVLHTPRKKLISFWLQAEFLPCRIIPGMWHCSHHKHCCPGCSHLLSLSPAAAQRGFCAVKMEQKAQQKYKTGFSPVKMNTNGFLCIFSVIQMMSFDKYWTNKQWVLGESPGSPMEPPKASQINQG